MSAGPVGPARRAAVDAAAAPSEARVTVSEGPGRAGPAWKPLPVVVAALDLGVLGDMLLRVDAPPAAGFALWVLAIGGTVVLLARRTRPLSRESTALVTAAVLFAWGLAWRDSPALKLLDMAFAAGLLALAAYGRGEAWLRGAGVVRYLRAVAAAGLSAGFGSLALATEVDWRGELGRGSESAWRRRALPVARGLVLSLPLLVLFGALLAGADAVFDQLLTRTIRLDVGTIVGHVALSAFLAWVAAGYLRELHAGPPLPAGALTLPRPRLGIVEVAVPLALVDLLFAAFVAVQVRYLFGGADVVQATAGLTYAEYARHGFFQLVWVAALVLPLLLAAEWLLERRGPGDEWLFRGLAGTQLLLVFAIMASALQRMRLYQAAYGLTELRLYTTAFMLWLAVAAAWLAATVLAGRRRRFALGALVSAAATLGALNALSPDALIVRVNAARAVGGVSFDALYAARLSGDAVPPLARQLARVPAAERCRVERVLARRWLSPELDDWRAWSVGSARARAAVRELIASDVAYRGCPAQATKPAPATSPARTTSPSAGAAGG